MMLVISNGAYKSGSTWLFNIISNLGEFNSPPEKYQNPYWENPSIAHRKLEAFLNLVDYQNRNYLSKNHFRHKKFKRLLLSYPDVYIIDIERDLRDVLVSYFFHYQRLEGYSNSFEKFYWSRGRLICDRIIRYHKLWSPTYKHIYLSSFDKFKFDFDSEVTRIAKFLGMAASGDVVSRVKSETTLKKLREKYSEVNSEKKFFRKGSVGEWREFFNKKMLKDISLIEKKGLPPRIRVALSLHPARLKGYLLRRYRNHTKYS